MIPQRAIDLILAAEGVDQPGKWPEGVSGITIGYGYDLGYEATFVADWKGVLPDPVIHALMPALGLRGEKAHRAATGFRGIKITPEQALQVFMKRTLPQEEKKTLEAFPGLEKLPGEVLGALVSLVFNRGPSMGSERRAEMRAIRDAIAQHAGGTMGPRDCMREIANQLRIMKRLWRGQGLDGLIIRREEEAKLVEAALAA